MTSRHPPRGAVWLLERAGVIARNEPLVGDLLEEFRDGRSAGWFWRQTFMAFAKGWDQTPALAGWLTQIAIVIAFRVLQIPAWPATRMSWAVMALFAVTIAISRTRRRLTPRVLFASSVVLDCMNGLFWSSLAGDRLLILAIMEAAWLFPIMASVLKRRSA